MLIDQAVSSGARLSHACRELGITERTYYRWKALDKEHGSCEDRRAFADHSIPANKLSPEERPVMGQLANAVRAEIEVGFVAETSYFVSLGRTHA